MAYTLGKIAASSYRTFPLLPYKCKLFSGFIVRQGFPSDGTVLSDSEYSFLQFFDVTSCSSVALHTFKQM